MSTDLTRPGLERPTTRTDIASHLLARAGRLTGLLDTFPLATEIQLLKRDLSRGHDVLRTARDTNFLSVVCLVEAALSSLTWKQYTPLVARRSARRSRPGRSRARSPSTITTPSAS